ncbi:16S rRNA (uracil1498-N3)-methyltransferase [Rubricella aquisinus]|uniref:Ribosomal RNA small subunit methyltransferase E n=1 Tax=Rubricella aquisinus TaxID=2028108 RepID=A0A840WTS8_9RHOB|nr:16S rRNA (uracil(1498)-N(3))-methyltransferase [Rubricella aquisinus]MBB5514620.1 16S rRNA (uracil1498-N3)-methyltransferase [Rubricella aquisinus]
MTDRAPKIRLFVEAELSQGTGLPLERDQANYLFNVMRLSVGSEILIFNGRDGEWRAEVVEANKRRGVLACREQTRAQSLPPDVWLLFAPIKKARTDFIVEKAAELGAREIHPVMTRYTNADRVRQDKLQAHAIEAAEQCGGVFVPPVSEPQKLTEALSALPLDRALMFCDERMEAATARDVLRSAPPGKWAILIGPEGGFSPEEAEMIRTRANTYPVTLGPRILRADTAAVAALTLWQSTLGDWAE